MIADEEVDAVYIATPVHLHAAQAIAAARAGKHVLCEKPMAMNVAECDEMIAACSENGVRLGVAYYRHFYPVIDRIRSLLASGEIGTPILAQMNAFEWFDPRLPILATGCWKVSCPAAARCSTLVVIASRY